MPYLRYSLARESRFKGKDVPRFLVGIAEICDESSSSIGTRGWERDADTRVGALESLAIQSYHPWRSSGRVLFKEDLSLMVEYIEEAEYSRLLRAIRKL